MRRTRLVAQGLGACLLAGLLVAGLLSPAAAATGFLSSRASASVDSADERIGDGRVDQATVVTDRHGAEIAHLYDEFRLPVGHEAMADTIKAAIIAIEDRRFFSHQGVDPQGVARAMARNAVDGSPLDGQGASTITMQYVKNYRLYGLAGSAAEERAATADTVGRKLTEVQLAARVEQSLDKDEILGRYLDLVYFGRGAYGVEAAARVFFDTTADRLDLAQAALLAAVVRSPTQYDPVENPDAAEVRRGLVLDAMVDVGSVTPAQAAQAAAAPLGVLDGAAPPRPGCVGATPGAGYFCAQVVDDLTAQGLDPAELRTGGYRITTTLDPEVTAAAQEAVAEVPTDTGVANVAAVVDPSAQGEVRALVANRPYGNDADDGQSVLPLTTAPLRGAGSVYKVFTAAAALEAGLVTPTTSLPVPDRYTSTEFRSAGSAYSVGNFGTYPGSLTLEQSLAQSPNTTFVELTDRLGAVDPIVDAAWRLGLRSTLEAPVGGSGADAQRSVREDVVEGEQASFTLGPTPTSPLDLASVGATIVEDGRWCAPRSVTAVVDRDGAPVPVAGPDCSEAFAPSTVAQLRAALSSDVTSGTASGAASAAGWDRDMIAKTGTTQRQDSAAFLGATDLFAGAVMTFSDQGAARPVCVGGEVRACGSGNLTGGSVPATTWFDAMGPLHGGSSTPLSTSGSGSDSDSGSGSGPGSGSGSGSGEDDDEA